MQQSKIGAGNAAAAAGAGSVNVYGARRTSSSLLMEPATQVSSCRRIGAQESFGVFSFECSQGSCSCSCCRRTPPHTYVCVLVCVLVSMCVCVH